MANRIPLAACAFGLLLPGAVVWTATPATTNEPVAGVTFAKHVLPIVQKNCQTCHRPGQNGPFSMLIYKETRPWARAIKKAVVAREMPPWFADPRYGHFNNDRSLTQAEIDTIASWVDGGAPEGNPSDAPPPVEWPEGGFQIKPDVTFELPPYEVPATGIMEWTYIKFPAPFKEDTWVTSIEILPGVPSVVHHYCVTFRKPRPDVPNNTYEWMEVPRDENGVAIKHDGRRTVSEGTVARQVLGSKEVTRFQGRESISRGEGSAFGSFCYLPGLPYDDYRPVGGGILVPAGSEMVADIHYTTNGLSVVDRTKWGFTVAKVPPAKKFLPTGGGEGDERSTRQQQANEKLVIPPYEANYLGPQADITFNRDVELVWFRPHAHVRGKSVKYWLTYPDGREEIVLNVPNWNFNWQLTYRTSIKIPKGSVMHFQFAYDNSTGNKYNPDPGSWVYYGGQSWEEMGTPNMGLLVDHDASLSDVIKEK